MERFQNPDCLKNTKTGLPILDGISQDTGNVSPPARGYEGERVKITHRRYFNDAVMAFLLPEAQRLRSLSPPFSLFCCIKSYFVRFLMSSGGYIQLI